MDRDMEIQVDRHISSTGWGPSDPSVGIILIGPYWVPSVPCLGDILKMIIKIFSTVYLSLTVILSFVESY